MNKKNQQFFNTNNEKSNIQKYRNIEHHLKNELNSSLCKMKLILLTLLNSWAPWIIKFPCAIILKTKVDTLRRTNLTFFFIQHKPLLQQRKNMWLCNTSPKARSHGSINGLIHNQIYFFKGVINGYIEFWTQLTNLYNLHNLFQLYHFTKCPK
jgi:hypothetical protein